MSDENNMKPPSCWIPMSDPVDLAALGKLCEEVNELGKIIARTIIQGINERDPETQYMNRHALEDELADVEALCRIVTARFGLNEGRMAVRTAVKIDHKAAWFKMLEEATK